MWFFSLYAVQSYDIEVRAATVVRSSWANQRDFQCVLSEILLVRYSTESSRFSVLHELSIIKEPRMYHRRRTKKKEKLTSHNGSSISGKTFRSHICALKVPPQHSLSVRREGKKFSRRECVGVRWHCHVMRLGSIGGSL